MEEGTKIKSSTTGLRETDSCIVLKICADAISSIDKNKNISKSFLWKFMSHACGLFVWPMS